MFELRLAFAIASVVQKKVPQYVYPPGLEGIYECATLDPVWWLAREVHCIAGNELLRRFRDQKPLVTWI